MRASGWPASALDGVPRLGWIEGPAPVTGLPGLAQELGLDWLGVKRDDLAGFEGGGSKFRKLDTLLATEPYASAREWASVGAIGSGHLVACTAAARRLGRRLNAYLFWEPISEGVVENLAFTAGGPTHLHYNGWRVGLALDCPEVWLGLSLDAVASIAPGGTSAAGMAGMVRAGLELADQVRAGEIPEPERLYVALGSGGNAAGLAVGLALGGLGTAVHAIAVVEWPLSPGIRIQALMRGVQKYLARAGAGALPELEPRLKIERGSLGPGYAHVTDESLAACERLAGHGIRLEPIYTGKAMAALLAGARGSGVRRVLFWNTARGPLPPAGEGWRERLPVALARRLAREAREARVSRRGFLVGGAAAGAALLLARTGGYPDLPAWEGRVLAAWQASVVIAAASVLLPPAPELAGFETVAANLDRYLGKMSAPLVREIRLMLAVLEHGPWFFAGLLRRFTSLPLPERAAYLSKLSVQGGTASMIYQGIRDLCMIGYYQQPAAWKALGYAGPWVGPEPRPRDARYAVLLAPPRALPQGVLS